MTGGGLSATVLRRYQRTSRALNQEHDVVRRVALVAIWRGQGLMYTVCSTEMC